MKKTNKTNKIEYVYIDGVPYLVCVDTETIGTCNDAIPFEIGIKIINLITREIVYQKSFIVRRYFNNKDVMRCTFSANKYPKYLEAVKDKELYFIGSVREIMSRIDKVFKRFNIEYMMAHHATFDIDAIANLCNEFGVFNPFARLDYIDSMSVSTIITFSKDYVDYCNANAHIQDNKRESAFITNSGRVRMTAQAIYSYLIKNPLYQEEHMALADIDIEIAILYASLDLLGNRQIRINYTPHWTDYKN